MNVLMPITLPSEFTNGPPEFPGLIAASVCIIFCNTLPDSFCIPKSI